MNIARPLWNVALVTYRSCCLSPLLSLDLRINCMIGAIELFLSYMSDNDQHFLPARPILSVDNLKALSIAHDTLYSDYKPDVTSSSHLDRLDNNRKNPTGLYTDSLFHFLCIDCGTRSADYDATLLHEKTDCHSSIKQKNRGCPQCNVRFATREEGKIHYSTFCRYTAGSQCPICGTMAASNVCTCGANANLYWDKIRDYVSKGTNKLMSVEHLEAVRALLHLYFLTKIDFAETGSVKEGSAEAGSAALDKEEPMTEEDVEVVMNALPTLKKDGRIHMPVTGTSLIINDIAGLWAESTLIPDEQDPNSPPTPSTPASAPGASATLTWDNFWHSSDEAVTPAELLSFYKESPKERKMELLNDAVGDPTIMGHLLTATIVEDRQDLLNKLFRLKSGVAEESDIDNEQEKANDNVDKNKTCELSLVKAIVKEGGNKDRREKFGSECYDGSDEEEDQEQDYSNKDKQDKEGDKKKEGDAEGEKDSEEIQNTDEKNHDENKDKNTEEKEKENNHD